MRVVARARHAYVHAPSRHVVGYDAPCGVHALVLVVVVPEPHPFHHIAIRGGIVVGTLVGVNEPGRLVDAPYASVPLDVLRVVEAYVGVRRLEAIELPFAHRRQPGWQGIRRHELIDNIRAFEPRDHAPPVAGEHGIGSHAARRIKGQSHRNENCSAF